MGPVAIPDIVGEVADLLLRDEGCKWSFCFGACNGQALLSLRTDEHQRDAGEVMRAVVAGLGTGGGHRAMGGGQVTLQDGANVIPPELATRIVERVLRALGITDIAGVPLVVQG
jgi:nanoRNase/pAp phosphatase (c-di-AMP/oligoRNAs hydrolase)